MSWEIRKNGDPSGGSETILKAEEKTFCYKEFRPESSIVKVKIYDLSLCG